MGHIAVPVTMGSLVLPVHGFVGTNAETSSRMSKDVFIAFFLLTFLNARTSQQ